MAFECCSYETALICMNKIACCKGVYKYPVVTGFSFSWMWLYKFYYKKSKLGQNK